MGNAGRFSAKAGSLLGVILCAVMVRSETVFAAAGSTCADPVTIAGTDFSKRFVQTRHLAGLNAPLVSEGVLRVRGDRVDWHARIPFDILTTIDANGITQSVDGGAPSRLEAISGGGIASIVSALAALLRGDFQSLKQTFAISFAEPDQAGRWTVSLTPLERRVTDLIGSMTVVGCSGVERVILRRPSGDYDRIEVYPLAPFGAQGDAAAGGNP